MADVVPSSACPALSSLVSQETLLESLDTALEQYLNLLDSYQKHRQLLAGHLSSGYIYIAEANFRSSSYTRYGQDFYDERMQAMMKISVCVKGLAKSPTFSIAASPASPGSADAAIQPAGARTGIIEGDSSVLEHHVDPVPSRTSQNPANWFGILTPQALREAQSSFRAAVRDVVPDLATTLGEMRSLEVEIEALRHKIRHSE